MVQQQAKIATAIARGARIGTSPEKQIRFSKMEIKVIETTRTKMIMENNTASTATSTAISMQHIMQRVIVRQTRLSRGLKRDTIPITTILMSPVITIKKLNIIIKKYTLVLGWIKITQVRRTKAQILMASISTTRAVITRNR
jgi:hypothetical protein